MREDDQVWWTIGSWRTSGRIDMVRADTIVDACLALRAEPCRVHECSTPYLLKLAADRPSEEPWSQPVESTPSVYDQFKRPGFSGWDYQAMRDLGYETD